MRGRLRVAGSGLLLSVRSLTGLALPIDCAGCGRPDVPLCPGCRAVLQGPPVPVPGPSAPAGLRAAAAVGYGGVAARIVVAWKEHGRHDLARPLAEALAVAVGDLLPERSAAGRVSAPPGAGSVLLVPVPSSRSARRRRGEDTMLRLALLAASRLRDTGAAPVRVVAALRLTRRVADQATLSSAGRRSNLAGALRVRGAAVPLVFGRPCLLLDDVFTTGATAAEGVRALRAAGAQVTGVATVCVTPLRRACDSPPNGVPVSAGLH